MDEKLLNTKINRYADFFEAMFWADINSDTENYSDDLCIQSIQKEGLIKLINDLESFFEKASDILIDTDYTHDQACHDFYLTRQGHGVGFWEADHCSKIQGRALTSICKEFGEIYISIEGDKIFID